MKRTKAKQPIGCRVDSAKLAEIDAAAKNAGTDRAGWILAAIDKQLGKRPRRTVQTRLARLEKTVRDLMGERPGNGT